MNRSRLGVLSIVTLCMFAPLAPAESKGTEPAAAAPATTAETEQLERFLYLVDHFARLSDNPTSSAIAAVLQAGDLLKDKPQDAIDYFNRTLPDVKNDSVRRVIRLQLADLYGRTNQPDKALEQLRELMILAPAASPHPAPKGPGASPAHSGTSSPK